MGRANGKHTQRNVPPQITNDEDPHARDIGASTRTQGVPSAIPGGRPHLTNAATVHQRPAVPDAKPEVRGVNAHGVMPGTYTTRERAEFMRGPNDLKPLVPHYRNPEPHEPVVPVRIVEQASTSIRTATAYHITLNAAGGQALRLCGVDPKRVELRLLNESQSSDIRFGYDEGSLAGGQGGLLPWPQNSYLTLPTQDELWAISADTGTPTISIVQVYERAY